MHTPKVKVVNKTFPALGILSSSPKIQLAEDTVQLHMEPKYKNKKRKIILKKLRWDSQTWQAARII